MVLSVIGRPYYWAWSCKGSLVEPFAAKVIGGTEDMVVTDLCSSKNFVSMITGTSIATTTTVINTTDIAVNSISLRAWVVLTPSLLCVMMATAKELYTQVLQDKAEEAPQYAWTRYNQVRA